MLPTSTVVAEPAAEIVMLSMVSVVQALLYHDCPDGHDTVTVTPELVILLTLLEAVIVVVPGDTAVSAPVVALIVATVVSEEA